MNNERQAGAPDWCSNYQTCKARSFHPPGVYTTFLAAWVEARRQLQQQLPQDVAAAVVAAVKAAREQQQKVEEGQGHL
jgi:hypothetical protein